jgi:hypothetical protein
LHSRVVIESPTDRLEQALAKRAKAVEASAIRKLELISTE